MIVNFSGGNFPGK